MLTKIVKEPLFLFLLIGLAIFLVDIYLNSSPETKPQIIITTAEIDRLNTLWQKQRQRPPTNQELQGLINAQIREEILYREAIAMGLDKNDTIVRRRMEQKLQFITEDLLVIHPPSYEQLRNYFQQHKSQYLEPSRYSFMHIYFDSNRRGPTLNSDLINTRQALNEAESTAFGTLNQLGDSIMLDRAFNRVTPTQIERIFGPEFAQQLSDLSVGLWQGPVPSGYGTHLVYLNAVIPGGLPDLCEVKEKVSADYQCGDGISEFVQINLERITGNNTGAFHLANSFSGSRRRQVYMQNGTTNAGYFAKESSTLLS